MNNNYDIIIVGGGHAGAEAALVTARMGMKCLLLTMAIDKIALMSCNPAIGGLAKGNLVKDLDALGGEMAKNIDATCIQFQMLNMRKGAAAQSSRGQADKLKYSKLMADKLLSQKGLDVKQAIASDIIIDDNKNITGLKTLCGQVFGCKKLILATGTFLRGQIYIGDRVISGGRTFEPASVELADSLKNLGFKAVRLKTGTPARIYAPSIDYSKLRPYETGDEDYKAPFSFETERLTQPQIKCYVTYTNPETHKLVRENLHRSLYYSSADKGVGPRYCPSMEDKVTKFADRDRHQIVLEPEGIDCNEVYPNGFSTSLPVDVQVKAYRTIAGLEKCEFTRPAYAIEYEAFQPTGLLPTYETKDISGLYFAGQINGTSGYEEAAVQGFMAGVNAVRSIRGEDLFILRRDESYIGVLTDDLMTKGVDEPYRMFTSRAEYRLHLREDNSEYRLLEYGKELGLISETRYRRFKEEEKAVENELERLKTVTVRMNAANNEILKKYGIELTQGCSARDILKRPESTYLILKEMGLAKLGGRAAFQVQTRIKYAGYIEKQNEDVLKQRKLEDQKIPIDFDYTGIAGLRREYIEKLTKIKPTTLGQALRIPGLTLSAIALLDIALAKSRRRQC